MPSKFRDGSILIEQSDLQLYLVYLVAVTAFFFALYEVLRICLERMQVEVYIEKDGD